MASAKNHKHFRLPIKTLFINLLAQCGQSEPFFGRLLLPVLVMVACLVWKCLCEGILRKLSYVLYFLCIEWTVVGVLRFLVLFLFSHPWHHFLNGGINFDVYQKAFLFYSNCFGLRPKLKSTRKKIKVKLDGPNRKMGKTH
ncbi:unnamed protein product [Ixodes pacificus]